MVKKNDKQIDKKQLVVGIVIFCVALLTLGYAFYEMRADSKMQKENKTVASPVESVAKETKVVATVKEPENVILKWSLNSQNDFETRVYYTQDKKAEFSLENSVSAQIKAGEHTYDIALPVKYIERLRINFVSNSGHIDVKELKLTGTQKADLSDLGKYEMFQFYEIEAKNDGTFSMTTMESGESYLLYTSEIKHQPEENKEKNREENDNTQEIKENINNQRESSQQDNI